MDGLDDWLADAQAREAADERIRERWLRQQAADEAAFAGLLADLAEGGETCVLTTAGARLHRGRVVAVGADFVAVRADGGRTTVVALHSVAVVRPEGERPIVPSAAPDQPPGLTLAGLLARAVADRPRVQVQLRDGDALVGELRSMGVDVVTLAPDTGGPAYVRLASISEISLFESG